MPVMNTDILWYAAFFAERKRELPTSKRSISYFSLVNDLATRMPARLFSSCALMNAGAMRDIQCPGKGIHAADVRNEDIVDLFRLVEVGSEVLIEE